MLLFGTAVQISGYQSGSVARLLFVVVALIALVWLVCWKPIRTNIPLQVRLGRKRPAKEPEAYARTERASLDHRGVRFEEWASGVSPPLCVIHRCPLMHENRSGPNERLDRETTIQNIAGLRMICPEDGALFTFEGLAAGRVRDVEAEASARLIGQRSLRR